MATWMSIYLLDAYSPIIEQIIFFHDHIITIIIIIVTLIGYFLIIIVISSFSNRKLIDIQSIEIIWTIVPIIRLIFIAIPSLQVLYLTDESISPSISIKSMGHQWFWSYEYSDFFREELNAYLDLSNNLFRLLNSDNHLIVPIETYLRIVVSSFDVIHSWTIPSIRVKMDAIPGRLNQSSFIIKRFGLLYGQCSEICGANHRFIPIVIEIINQNNFIKWINNI